MAATILTWFNETKNSLQIKRFVTWDNSCWDCLTFAPLADIVWCIVACVECASPITGSIATVAVVTIPVKFVPTHDKGFPAANVDLWKKIRLSNCAVGDGFSAEATEPF